MNESTERRRLRHLRRGRDGNYIRCQVCSNGWITERGSCSWCGHEPDEAQAEGREGQRGKAAESQ